MAFGGHLLLARTEVHNGTRWQPGAVVCLAALPANASGPCSGHDPVALVCVKVSLFGRCQSAIWHFARSLLVEWAIVDGRSPGPLQLPSPQRPHSASSGFPQASREDIHPQSNRLPWPGQVFLRRNPSTVAYALIAAGPSGPRGGQVAFSLGHCAMNTGVTCG